MEQPFLQFYESFMFYELDKYFALYLSEVMIPKTPLSEVPMGKEDIGGRQR